ncbi:hypothetical protein [Planktotalea frisia]|uniref:hypothetical protein n=1 Tax=Planktotalea frisia TaxID=696762 RepID=UPI00233186AE|nr:hypothetical protein [Planktotalea frisia]MDB4092180.1 hypothetical protein [bacterium]
MFAATNAFSIPLSKISRIAVLTGLALCVTACGSKTPDVITVASNIRTTGDDGFVVWDTLFEEQNTQHLDDDNVGYALKTGVNSNGTAIAFVGMFNEDQIEPPTGSGTAVYRGTSRAVSMRTPNLIEAIATLGLVDGSFVRAHHTAPVTLQANLDDGTFQGENGETTGDGGFTHRFNGQFTNGRMTGEGLINTGTLSSLGTKLEGRIGDDKTTLVFKATRTDQIAIAGGMNLERSN